ncbi:thermonuclease family protein [Planococcus sp. ISL-109]|nr:thermonuclease family protein [Planococcus sp. ISL-109]
MFFREKNQEKKWTKRLLLYFGISVATFFLAIIFTGDSTEVDSVDQASVDNESAEVQQQEEDTEAAREAEEQAQAERAAAEQQEAEEKKQQEEELKKQEAEEAEKLAEQEAEEQRKQEEAAKKKAEEEKEEARLVAEQEATEKAEAEKIATEKAAQEKAEAEKNSIDTAGTTDQIPVQLVKTIDGDTIKVIYDGQEINIRYLLIDTPETSHPQLGKQPFGEEAKARNLALVNSGQLTIEFDVGQRLDRYDRLLAYVYVDGKSVQEILLSEGLARVAYVYPPNTRHLTPYEEAQAQAKAKGIGIWSIENYVSADGFEGTVPSGGSSGSSSSGSTASPPASSEEKEIFQNCTELKKVYPDGVPQGHKAYLPKMDRDKDGWACES